MLCVCHPSQRQNETVELLPLGLHFYYVLLKCVCVCSERENRMAIERLSIAVAASSGVEESSDCQQITLWELPIHASSSNVIERYFTVSHTNKHQSEKIKKLLRLLVAVTSSGRGSDGRKGSSWVEERIFNSTTPFF